MLALTLDEASAKIRDGPPLDDEEDDTLDTWAGVIPLHTNAGAPMPNDRLACGIAPPETIRDWTPQRA